MNAEQKEAINEAIKQGQHVISIYKRKKGIYQSYELCANISALMEIVETFVTDIEARGAAILISEATWVVNKSIVSENYHDVKYLAVEAEERHIRLKEIVESIKNL